MTDALRHTLPNVPISPNQSAEVRPPYRLRFTVTYDGAAFDGWQSQPGGNTIQDHLQLAFATIEGAPVTVHGAGRTDAGVHALGQVAHADVHRLSPGDWPAALNANLPNGIRVIRATRASANFHARFSARGKRYRYQIWNSFYLHPLHRGQVWHVPGKLDLTVMKKGAELLAGRHDFRAFAANRGRPDEDSVRTLSRIRLSRAGPLVTLEYDGDGFLYRMVRILTGSLVRLGHRREELEWIRALLAGKGKSRYAAPAQGLFLVRVNYGTRKTPSTVAE